MRTSPQIIFVNFFDLYHMSPDSGERHYKSRTKKRRIYLVLAPCVALVVVAPTTVSPMCQGLRFRIWVQGLWFKIEGFGVGCRIEGLGLGA
jgi:hypothetical protein